ncbi:MAG: hypothetical protein LC808_28760 [Actinobacteria bacterium]|nr:hypothetical protein [Actinomycetota bacterium]
MQKYEILLQLVRQEKTITEATEQRQVDPWLIMRIRAVGGTPGRHSLVRQVVALKGFRRDIVPAACTRRQPLDGSAPHIAVGAEAQRVDPNGRWSGRRSGEVRSLQPAM